MLHLFSIFHLNLAYSSIEEAQRPEVVRRCYWPLLRLAERTGSPLGIEATGYTLEAAAAIDPSWLEALRALVASGRCEFVGSGYAQVIGPLVPAAVNAANLRLGDLAYERLLGFRPRLAFVNEQAYAAGLIQHHIDAGHDAIVMEWDNPARAHPEWDAEWRYFPQVAAGQHGESIPLIWNKAIAFQQFQRYAHDELRLEEYLAYLAGHLPADPAGSRALAMYGNDAEVFDFRPGRYRTEAALGDAGEWTRIERMYAALAADPRFKLILPSDALALGTEPKAGHRLHLESAADPTPVKKQRKYNITRWAVTGRDDIGVNTACWRRHATLAADPAATDAEWQELCELWSSDYRTHITELRWKEFVGRVYGDAERAAQPQAHGAPLPSPPFQGGHGGRTDSPVLHAIDVARDGPLITLKHDGVTLVLNSRRGLAIHALSFDALGGDVLCGTLRHGFYDDIHWGADFYSGMLVMESPGYPKLTDLNRVQPVVGWDPQGALVAESTQTTELGPIVKRLRVANGSVELSYRLDWPELPIGSLRLGDMTLNPNAFDRASLFYGCHNGGVKPEIFALDDTSVAHGEAVSFLVSASHAVGMTEGAVEIGDRARIVRIEADKTAAAVVGMVTYQPIRDTYFCRVSFSAAEVDETRRPRPGDRVEPLVCRFRITAEGSSSDTVAWVG